MIIKKRGFLFVLILVAVFCLALCGISYLSSANRGRGPLTASAELTEKSWSTYIQEQLALGFTEETLWPSYFKEVGEGGNAGTADDPYLIKNATELAMLAVVVNTGSYEGASTVATEAIASGSFAGKYIRITANIDLGNYYWVPIGYFNDNSSSSYLAHKPFLGSIDGGMYNESGVNTGTYSISNLIIDGRIGNIYNEYVKKYGATTAGLFGYVGSKYVSAAVVAGQVKNLLISNASVFTSSTIFNSGIVAGINCGDFNRVLVIGGSITSTKTTDSGRVNTGGLVGISRGGNYMQCMNTSNVTGSYVAGGIAGNFAAGAGIGECPLNRRSFPKVVDSANTGNVTGEQAGGIGGSSTGMDGTRQTSFYRCASDGVITGKAVSAANGVVVGGLVGTMTSGSITYSYNVAAVNVDPATNSGVNAGGIAGRLGASIDGSYNYGLVQAVSGSGRYSGVFAGYLTATFGCNLNNYYVVPNSDSAYAQTAFGNGGGSQNKVIQKTVNEFLNATSADLLWQNANLQEEFYGADFPMVGQNAWRFVAGTRPQLRLMTYYVDIGYESATDVYAADYKKLSVNINPASIAFGAEKDFTYTVRVYSAVYNSGTGKDTHTLIGTVVRSEEDGNFASDAANTAEQLIKDAGKYYVTVECADGTIGYGYGAFGLTVKQRPVIVNPVSTQVTYGTTAPTEPNTSTVVFNSNYYNVVAPSAANNTGLLGSDTITGNLTRSTEGSYTGAGVYPYDASTLVVSKNYVIQLGSTGAFTINKMELTMSFENIAVTYGDNAGISLFRTTRASDVAHITGIIPSDSGKVNVAFVDFVSVKETSIGAGLVPAGTYNGDIRVAARGVELGGSAGGNYFVDMAKVRTAVGNISMVVNKAPLTIVPTHNPYEKYLGVVCDFSDYDFTVNGFKNGDTVVSAGLTVDFTSEGASADAPIAATSGGTPIRYDVYVLSFDTDNVNYVINGLWGTASPVSVGTIIIKQAATLTINPDTLGVENKTYDGTAAATVRNKTESVPTGALTAANFAGMEPSSWPSEYILPTAEAVFTDSNVGTGKAVIITITAPYGCGYVLTNPRITGEITGNISPRAVTVSVADSSVQYQDTYPKLFSTYNPSNPDANYPYKLSYTGIDGAADGVKAELDRLLLPQFNFSVDGIATASSTAYVGIYGINAIISGGSLNGGSNFALTYQAREPKLNITPYAVAVPVFTAGDKVYDGTNYIGASDITFLTAADKIPVGVLVGDKADVRFEYNAEFSDVNVGEEDVVLTFTLTGDKAYNYTWATSNVVAFKAQIKPRPVTVSFTAADNSSVFARQYGYVLDTADLNFKLVETGTTTFPTALASEYDFVKGRLEIVCTQDGEVVGGLLAHGVYDIVTKIKEGSENDLRNYLFQHEGLSTQAVGHLRIDKRELPRPIFTTSSTTIRNVTYGESVSAPEAYLLEVTSLSYGNTSNTYVNYLYNVTYTDPNNDNKVSTTDVSNIKNVGRYVITVMVAPKDGYKYRDSNEPTDTITYTINIRPKDLYVYADTYTNKQGSVPDLTELSLADLKFYGEDATGNRDAGFAYGENYSVLKGRFTASSSATAASSPNTYYISLDVANLSSPNYKIIAASGDNRGKIVITKNEDNILTGASGAIVVENIIDAVDNSLIILDKDNYSTANAQAAQKITNGTLITVYLVELKDGEEDYVSANKITIKLKVPDGNYAQLRVFTVTPDGKLEEIVANDTNVKEGFFVFESFSGGTYAVIGSAAATGTNRERLFMLIGIGAGLIIIASIVAIILVKRVEKKNVAGEGLIVTAVEEGQGGGDEGGDDYDAGGYDGEPDIPPVPQAPPVIQQPAPAATPAPAVAPVRTAPVAPAPHPQVPPQSVWQQPVQSQVPSQAAWPQPAAPQVPPQRPQAPVHPQQPAAPAAPEMTEAQKRAEMMRRAQAAQQQQSGWSTAKKPGGPNNPPTGGNK